MARQYYDALSAERLRMCYDLAPAEVREYLAAEVGYILGAITLGARVLELGCGYGRVLSALAPTAAGLFGIDLSLSSLRLARRQLHQIRSVGGVSQANAVALPFPSGVFDLVCCPQNGISAFHLDPRRILAEALRVTAPSGRVMFFSYADEFWPHRLAWFRIQAARGLIGPINEAATHSGTIVCNDGFTATTITPEGFSAFTSGLAAEVNVFVLQHSSVVCDITTTRATV